MAFKKRDQDEFWKQQVAGFRASGLSRREYCRKHGLKIHQLGYRIDRWKTGILAGKSAFARVAAAEPQAKIASAGCCAARIALSGGATLEFVFDSDPAFIARLISHIGGRL